MTSGPHVIVHTDGACSGNPGPGGWGVILEFGATRREMKSGEPHTTNNRMELTAAITALVAWYRRDRDADATSAALPPLERCFGGSRFVWWWLLAVSVVTFFTIGLLVVPLAVLAWLINAVALVAVAYLVPGISVDTFVTALVAALILGLINTFIRPLLVLFTLPVTILTLGLFIFVINGLVFWFVGSYISGFGDGSGTATLNPATNKPCDDLIPVFEQMTFLSKEDREKILFGNARKLFPLLRVN